VVLIATTRQRNIHYGARTRSRFSQICILTSKWGRFYVGHSVSSGTWRREDRPLHSHSHENHRSIIVTGMTELPRLLIILRKNSTKEVRIIVSCVYMIVGHSTGKYRIKSGKVKGVTPQNVRWMLWVFQAIRLIEYFIISWTHTQTGIPRKRLGLAYQPGVIRNSCIPHLTPALYKFNNENTSVSRNWDKTLNSFCA
jgi:hypothetical protein